MSEKPMQEGSRLWIEFAKDGTLIATGGIAASATCTFGDGELTLTVTEDGRSDALHMRVGFTPTEMTMTGADPAVPFAQNVTTHYKRTGGLTDPAAPQVGTWRASPGNEDGITFRFAADGTCGMRVPYGGRDTGRWSSRHDTYTINGSGPLPYRKRGDVLTLTMDMGKLENMRFIQDTF